ncbi:armadillo-type protein [Neohortaea acidophila]|uniref:Armadillo-type protein n=1 Tax=Neohortaea acidophila TaxID=245834 RepID=A0A6A6Q5J1_9PEZI|nr:armadillo-type protein [Neohortaea acidophila]KAF2487331.1 armadillo-type protein [Neohortaea acidophila]
MKARKPSKVVKRQKQSKRTTSTTNLHRYQSFSERIANLKIDPIRRRRKLGDQEELVNDTATYFGRSLEEWRDLNLSQNFSAFVKEVAPLSDSLPGVLHNEGKIMDLLMAYIEKGDGLSLEPLLSLLSHFAHDLDTRFEKHFARAVATVTRVAARHADPAVVEWSFTCLAWLFKYLSRLLVPDLRPLYDLMAPYLGKESQKPFIIRFAAESLSFLMRKTATSYQRDCEPLDIIMSHILDNCDINERGASQDMYQQGVMTLLTESMKGVQGGLHSGGTAVLQSLLKILSHPDRNQIAATEVTIGTLTSLIHHVNAQGFVPVQETIVDFISNLNLAGRPLSMELASRLLFTIAAVRNGGRVRDWAPLTGLVGKLLKLAAQDDYEAGESALHSLLSATALTLQHATIDATLSASDSLKALRQGTLAPYFLQFCDLFARLGRKRFSLFVLPEFKRFVLEQYAGNESSILQRLPALAVDMEKGALACPDALQQHILTRFQSVVDTPETDDIMERVASADLALSACPTLKLAPATIQKLHSAQFSLLQRALEDANFGSTAVQDFALGVCFETLVKDGKEDGDLAELWPKLCSESHRYLHLTRFWSTMQRLLERSSLPSPSLEGAHIDALTTSLLDCLSMPSHEIRQAALEIIQALYTLRKIPVPEVLMIACTIESTPVSLETSRGLSMNIRRLGADHQDMDDTMGKAIPRYCFGLLNLRLSQAWDDAANVLAHVAKTSLGEDTIAGLAQAWIEDQTSEPTPDEEVHRAAILDKDSTGFQAISDFECFNFARSFAICRQVFETPDSGRLSAEEQFQAQHVHIPSIATNSREQALRVLSKIPTVAEKRSRMLVPILLRWAGAQDGAVPDEQDEAAPQRWKRKDQKAMLAIFAQFTNPKVLFKSDEVYTALLNLCANGDVEIQQHALKAIFAWKHSGVNQYSEHLNNLLDESRFREELSVFLQNDDKEQEGVIQPEDHPKLMPVLLRLLYGRAVAGGQHGQGSRRKAVFIAMSRYGEDVLGMFVDIALGSLRTLQLTADHELESLLALLSVPLRQQLGMLNMLEDMLQTLGPDLQPFAAKLLTATLLCTVAASRKIERGGAGEDLKDNSLLRSVRQAGIQCLVHIFSTMETPDVTRYAHIAVEELIAPRLSKFASENTQGVSGILRLLAAWASSSAHRRFLIEFDVRILDSIADLLREPNTKDEVRLFVLQEALEPILREDANFDFTSEHISRFGRSIGEVLSRETSKPVLDACISVLTLLSGRIRDSEEAEAIVTVCTDLLTKPNKIVSNATKVGLLKTILSLLQNGVIDLSSVDRLYDALCGLFSRFHDSTSRLLLSEVLLSMSRDDEDLAKTATICQDLDSTTGISREPDHARREAAFAKVYAQSGEFSLQQWKPLVHVFLFYVRDEDDLVNRTSATRALQRFLDAASKDVDTFKPLISSAVLPGIVYGVKSQSELVRAEYLLLLGYIVEKLPQWPAVEDMRSLIVDGDEEASFFTNILHIQQHRRLRALRRLSDEAPKLRSSNVTQFFIPLLEHFVFHPAEGDSGRTLADQSVATLGALAQALNWSVFRATFKRYANLLKSEDHDEKVTLRLLSVFVDAISTTSGTHDNVDSTEQTSKRSETVKRELLPPLVGYLHHKDESTVDRRMPVAITIAKLLLTLPQPDIASRLPPVLTDVCQVLRSRSQEARDQARKSLASIFSLVGPTYFGFLLKELRSALQRGSQLHVLSFTVHSLLVNTVSGFEPGELDECLPDLMSIIMDDIFGATGQEKDAEEYKSAMKEVKSSKSFDTMELLATVTPIQRLGRLVQPLQALLAEKLDIKVLTKIDDLLSRLRKGIDRNAAADSRDTLVFCHEIVRQAHVSRANGSAGARSTPVKVNRYIMQAEPDVARKARRPTTSQSFKLVSFALSLLRRVLQRHEDLMTPVNLAGFLPIAGDSLVEGHEEVQLAAVKLLSTIMRVKMAELDSNAALYVKEAMRIINGAPSMTTDSARAALELVTCVLRERRTAEVRDRDLADVLKALKNDLDEPDRQGIVYKFLRAVLGRKIMITEVYEIMDEVGKVIVTNPDRSVQEGARSAYLQFVLEYPQGKERLRKQSGYLVENLKYEHATGRQSIMELLHQLLSKLPDDALSQMAFTLFIALVPIQVADADQSCRRMAALLIGKIFERSTEEQMATYLGLMAKWLQNQSNPGTQTAALQCWMVLLRARVPSAKHVKSLCEHIEQVLHSDDAKNSNLNAALQTFQVLVDVVPDVAFARESAGLWDKLSSVLRVGDVEVKELAAKLMEVLFSHLASTSSKTGSGLANLPLRGSGGLALDADQLRQWCYSSLRTLRAGPENTSEALQTQTARNLVFLGRCFAANGMKWREVTEDASDDEEEEDETMVDTAQAKDPSAIAYLFNRLTYIIRQENLPTTTRTAAVQCQTALISVTPSIPNLESVLQPLYSLTDTTVTRPEGETFDQLVDKAREVMDVIQKKVGSEVYITALGVVRAAARERREERRRKRRIEAVSAPEKWAKEKKRKHEARKGKMKERADEARGRRRGW